MINFEFFGLKTFFIDTYIAPWMLTMQKISNGSLKFCFLGGGTVTIIWRFCFCICSVVSDFCRFIPVIVFLWVFIIITRSSRSTQTLYNTSRFLKCLLGYVQAWGNGASTVSLTLPVRGERVRGGGGVRDLHPGLPPIQTGPKDSFLRRVIHCFNVTPLCKCC